MSKVVVVGAGGMLGHKVCQRLAHHEVIGLVRKPAETYSGYSDIFGEIQMVGGVDVLDDVQLTAVILAHEPAFVVNCVGLVKQLNEANDPVLGVAINSLLPHRLAALCQQVDGRLIHISTDCVFDGRQGRYTEMDLPNARDFYGRSKALGETMVIEASAITLRTSFIGRELKAHTHGLVEWLLSREGGSVSGFERVIYSGLTSLELAGVIGRIVDRDPGIAGVHHVASDPITKYDLLRLIRDVYELDIRIESMNEPVADRSLIMGSFAEATGYRNAGWLRMITEMHEDPTPYDERKLGA